MVGRLSEDPAVDGVLLQHPVPVQVDERAAFEAIRPEKDVDGVTMRSFASMAFDLPGFLFLHRRRGSCASSMSTASILPVCMRSSSAAARFSASRSACCCWPGTPP